MATDSRDEYNQLLNAIVQSIGFGVVSDFRSLRDAIIDLSSIESRKITSVDSINKSTTDMSKSLDRLQQDIYRQRETRAYRSIESSMERRNAVMVNQSQATFNKILATMTALKAQSEAANKKLEEEDGPRTPPAAPPPGTPAAIPPGVAAPAAAAAATAATAADSGDSGLLGATGEVVGVMGTGYAVQSAIRGGAAAAPAAAEVAGIGAQLAAPGAAAPSTTTTVNAAKNTIGGTMKTATQRALSKVASKLPSYLTRNAARLVAAIGAKNVPVLGAFVGGWFAMKRFFQGDSWTAIGAEFVSGVAVDVGVLGGPAGVAAGIATSIAIQTYLICRDIYQEENASDIAAGIVPNFDDLPLSERKNVIMAVGSQVEAFINNIIRGTNDKLPDTKPAGSTTTPSGAPVVGTAAAAAAAATSGNQSPTTGQIQQPPMTVGTGAGMLSPEPAAERAPPSPQYPQGTSQAPAAESAPPSPSYAYNTASDVETDDSSVSPGGRPTATGTASGDYRELLDFIADSEGADYNTQFGYQNTTGGVPLTQLTVAEIMEAQKAQSGSSAIGRYQFMRQTMIDGINAGIISPEQKFTPELQDRLARYLIDVKRRGAAWRAGRLSDEAFAQGLAQEWASIPSPYTGGGYYPGQRAKYGVDSVMSVLQASKGINVAAMADGATVTPLPSDTPRASSGVLLAPKTTNEQLRDEYSSETIGGLDARPRNKSVDHEAGKDVKRNSLDAYNEVAVWMFGDYASELMTHAKGESTADYAFERALNPIV